MLWLGTSSSPEAIELIRSGRIGLMATPKSARPGMVETAAVWAGDNGCFSDPESFHAGAYLSWLNDYAADGHADRCLFVTAPDVVGDAAATMAGAPFLAYIREVGFPAALVAQDGLEELDVPWDELDVLFVGGTDPWRASAAVDDLVAEARARGKWTHLGRVNSWRRLEEARARGFDSTDGTFLRYGPDANLPALQGWLDRLDREPMLDLHPPRELRPYDPDEALWGR
jgi:hypothetical protein